MDAIELILLHKEFNNSSYNIEIVKLRCRFNLWVSTEISIMRLMHHFADEDNYDKIKKYNELII